MNFRVTNKLIKRFCFNHLHITRVVGLLCWACPLAVSGFVISVVINPIYGKVWRAISHIRKKIVELKPTLTNLYSTSTINSVFGILWVSASLNHSSPRNIRPCFFTPDAMAVSNWTVSSTPTGLEDFQGLRMNIPFDPTIAPAFVRNPLFSISSERFYRAFDNYNLAEPLSDEGYCFRHNVSFGDVVFSDGRPATTGAHCD